MKLKLLRYNNSNDSTGGLIFIDDIFHGYTCEDEKREIKVPGETCIPVGTYKIKFRDAGGMTKRYAKKFPGIHRGMLWLQNVPGFEWVYIHIGNTDDNTEGCILVGYGARNVMDENQVTSSTDCYKDLYKMIVASMDAGEEVEIEIKEV